MDLSRRASTMVRSRASSFKELSAANTRKYVLEPLRELFLNVDSTSSKGRKKQRFRLVFLPLLPTAFFAYFSIRWLVIYSESMNHFSNVHNQVLHSFDTATFVVDLNREKSLQLYKYVSASSRKTSNASADLLCNASTGDLEQIFALTNKSVKAVMEGRNLIIGKLTLQDDFHKLLTTDTLSVLISRARMIGSHSNTSTCKNQYEMANTEYSLILDAALRFLPKLYQLNLWRSALTMVYAFYHLLEAHLHFANLCHLASGAFERGFLNLFEHIYFVGNFTAGKDSHKLALFLLDQVFEPPTIVNFIPENVKSRLFLEQASAIEGFKKINISLEEWFGLCLEYARTNEIVIENVSQSLKNHTFHSKWQEILTGLALYVTAVVINILLLLCIFLNAEFTIRNLKHFSSLFQKQADELSQEKDRTEILLSEMLPKSVAQQLSEGLTVEAETFESSTIYFSDIVAFHELTLYADPIDVVNLLNGVYNLLDHQIECYDVYKVETIGSVYMVVSGVPARNGQQHVSEIADLSLNILKEVERQNFPSVSKKIELRIGIHTGPCVSGVVGNKMTRYCLFGDTVNTASRMQSTGAASKIHLSESTFTFLNELNAYSLSKRGTLEVKGKGTMVTYWLDGKL